MDLIVYYKIFIFFNLDCLAICVIGTSTLFFFLILFTLLKNNFKIVKIIHISSYLFFIISYLSTSLINPGIPSFKFYSKNFVVKDKEQLRRYQKCKKCNIIILKKYKVSHCDICDICVIGYDHHCPWSGKCIGKYNIWFFCLFIFSFFIYSLSSFLTYIFYFIYNSNAKNNKK